MGGEELKWRQLAHHHIMSLQGPHFSPHSKAKANYKSTNLRKIFLTSVISDVAIVSVYSEKTCLKEIDFHYETKARKVMIDFKFDALYREVFIESILKSD